MSHAMPFSANLRTSSATKVFNLRRLLKFMVLLPDSPDSVPPILCRRETQKAEKAEKHLDQSKGEDTEKNERTPLQ
jgi:hypothetical protein